MNRPEESIIDEAIKVYKEALVNEPLEVCDMWHGSDTDKFDFNIWTEDLGHEQEPLTLDTPPKLTIYPAEICEDGYFRADTSDWYSVPKEELLMKALQEIEQFVAWVNEEKYESETSQ